MLHRVALWSLYVLIPVAAWLVLAAVRTGRFRHLYHRHLGESRRERQFLASLAFFLTFAIVRALTHAIHARRGPFHILQMGGRHIHHMVWGISLLLVVGYGWLMQVGTGMGQSSRVMARVMALLYGIGAALTLDEFALWLNLEDVYWLPQGRESVQAVLLFGSLLSVGVWGARFIRALGRESWRLVKYPALAIPHARHLHRRHKQRRERRKREREREKQPV
jgi:hypothetical protein